MILQIEGKRYTEAAFIQEVTSMGMGNDELQWLLIWLNTEVSIFYFGRDEDLNNDPTIDVMFIRKH